MLNDCEESISRAMNSVLLCTAILYIFLGIHLGQPEVFSVYIGVNHSTLGGATLVLMGLKVLNFKGVVQDQPCKIIKSLEC